MTRKQNPFTDRQIKFLKSIQDKIREINDLDKPYISHESYSFKTKQTKQFGKIPKIIFSPHGTQIKADIIRKAGFFNQSRETEIDQIRQELKFTKPRDKEHRILARLFDAEWNNLMLKAKKATFSLAWINNLFTVDDRQIADPVLFLQDIVLDEYAGKIKTDKKIVRRDKKLGIPLIKKSYEDELMEIK